MQLHKAIIFLFLSAGFAHSGQVARELCPNATFYYNFNGTAVYNSGAIVATLTNSNAAVVSGMYGEAATFTGASGQYMQATGFSTITVSTPRWFHVLMKTTNTNGRNVFVVGGTTSQEYALNTNAGIARFQDGAIVNTGVSAIADNKWRCYDFTVTQSGSNYIRTLYVNGVLDFTGTNTTKTEYNVFTMTIGARTARTFTWTGTVDDLYIAMGCAPSAGALANLCAEQLGRLGDE